MKKLLAAAVALAALATFTGLSGAQERKAGEKPAAIGLNPNTVTLSETKNVAPLKGCPVTAWVGYKKLPVGGPAPVPTPGYTVNFVKVPSGSVIGTRVSGANGNTPSFTVPSSTTIQATVSTANPPLTSNNFVCSGGLIPAEK